MSEHEILERIFSLMRREILMVRNGKNNNPRPVKNTSKQMCYNVLTEIQEMLGTNCYYIVPPKITNADRIRSMSDEELAKWIYSLIIDRYIGVPVKDWLDWLKQAAT